MTSVLPRAYPERVMQIENDPKRRQTRSDQVQSASRAARETGESPAGNFQQKISASAAQIKASLDQLMLDVDSAAQQLLQNPAEGQLTRYTQAVRQFLRKAQGEAFAISRHFDRHNRLYMLVREVDAQLASLTDQVLSTQGRALEMAARIQEIRGILLDMYI